MKKRNLFVIGALVAVMSLIIAAPTGASEGQGCTPGYWKQPHHLDSWGPTGYSPDDIFFDVFGVGPDDLTLLDALWLRGGHMNAFMRHAVAALLNAAHPLVAYPSFGNPMGVDWVIEGGVGSPECGVRGVFDSTCDWELQKWHFEFRNEYGCPLD